MELSPVSERFLIRRIVKTGFEHQWTDSWIAEAKSLRHADRQLRRPLLRKFMSFVVVCSQENKAFMINEFLERVDFEELDYFLAGGIIRSTLYMNAVLPAWFSARDRAYAVAKSRPEGKGELSLFAGLMDKDKPHAASEGIMRLTGVHEDILVKCTKQERTE